MRKIIELELLEDNIMICKFDNNEQRILNLREVVKDKYAKKIIADVDIFKKAKIGQFGEIYWASIAEIKDQDGVVHSCEYDISPEFAYLNSKPL